MHFFKKFLTTVTLAVLVFAGSVVSKAQAADTLLEMYPGQKAKLSVSYQNVGDSETLLNALLKIYVGNGLILDKDSIFDQYDGGTKYQISPTLAVSGNIWGNTITYRPRSATNATAPSGSGERGNAIVAPGKTGVVTFNVQLKEDILNDYEVGDILAPVENQGSTSVLEFQRSNGQTGQTQPGGVRVKIIADPNPEPEPVPQRTNLAKPDPAKTTGGGFDSTKAQPIYTTTTFNPNPGKIGEGIQITTQGLLDSGTSESLNNSPCTIYLKGANGFASEVSSTVQNGICQTNFTASQTPKAVGTYQSVTKVNGPSGELFTAPSNVDFILATSKTNPVLPRTGGISSVILLTILAMLVVGGSYVFTRRKKLTATVVDKK